VSVITSLLEPFWPGGYGVCPARKGIRFMFNGDRLAFVKGYKLKDNGKQPQLPGLDEQATAPATGEITLVPLPKS
jgi:hypothetical protein